MAARPPPPGPRARRPRVARARTRTAPEGLAAALGLRTAVGLARFILPAALALRAAQASPGRGRQEVTRSLIHSLVLAAQAGAERTQGRPRRTRVGAGPRRRSATAESRAPPAGTGHPGPQPTYLPLISREPPRHGCPGSTKGSQGTRKTDFR
jgi:hypothetical protein